MKKNIFCSFLFILSLFFFTSAELFAEGIQEKEVEVIGRGETREKAIKDGFVQAIGQVLGVQLSADTVLKEKIEENFNISENFNGERHSDTSLFDISGTGETNRKWTKEDKSDTSLLTLTKTKGNVKSYRIISEGPSEFNDGTYKVQMLVTVSYYDNPSSQDGRKRIAVLPFRVAMGGQGENLFTFEINQAATDYLTQTRNFVILDRDFLQEKFKEFRLLEGDDIILEERARIGSSIGSDYILVGRITSFNLNTIQEKIPYINKYQLIAKGNVSVAWRLIHAPTGQISASGTHDEKIKTKVKDESDFNFLVAMARPIGQEIGRKIADTIYPIVIMANNGGILTVSRGGDSIKKGQYFNLIKYGDVLMDPYTGKPMARDEIPVGKVEIISVFPKISHARIVETFADLNGLKPNEYILRLAEQPKPEKKKPRPTRQPNW